MLDRDRLKDVRRALEAGGRGRHVDYDLALAVGHEAQRGQARFTGEFAPSVVYRFGPYAGMAEPLPCWTEDLSAAVVFVHHVLPTWRYELGGGFRQAARVALFDPQRRDATEIVIDARDGRLATALASAAVVALDEGLAEIPSAA